MDLVTLSETTAALVATGAAQGVGEHIATGTFAGMVRRIREVFGADRRALQSLEETVTTGDGTAARDLAAALRWHAERDETFAADLDRWAGNKVAQKVRAGRDAYVAGRDQTVTHNHFGD